MKIRAALFSLLFLFLLSPRAWPQGSLTPPGAPAPTMKTLDQIEPRRPISKLPFTASQPGSYYLTKNLQFTAVSGNAITITVSNVTLDLMGFTLSSSNAVNGDAIRVNSDLRNITVKNGAIAGNSTVAITGIAPNQTWTLTGAGFSVGISASLGTGTTNCKFTDLHISGCRAAALSGGNYTVVDRVIATHNGGGGIFVSFGSLSNCTAFSNRFTGLSASFGSVANCTAFSNGTTGIFAGSITNSSARANGSDGINGSSVANCTADDNEGNGIFAFSGSVTNSSCANNGSNGISVLSGSITNCVATSNKSDGIFTDRGSVTNSTALFNDFDGIDATGGVVAFCKAFGNNNANNGSVDIDALGATRTGNSPTP